MTGLAPSSIAVGLPCYREAKHIPLLARALQRLDPAPSVIIAVDDGSGDSTGHLLQEAGFEVLTHQENLGLGATRNSLWRRGEELGMSVIAYLDADVLPPADYIERVRALLDSDRLAGVGGQNLDGDPSSRVDAWRGRFWPQSLGSTTLMDAPMLIGACATYRIAALREVGGFNPRFRSHGEDVEIGRRLRLHGKRLLYSPELVVHHQRHDSAVELLGNCYRHCREGMRATLGTPGEQPEAGRLALGLGRKLVHAPAASLLRRRDPREAALGLAACSAGLLGYFVGWSKP